MGANGISNLPTKEARQIAKLDLAQTKRQAQGEVLDTYDRDLLPAKYVGNESVSNPGTPPKGRPWT